MCGRRARVTLDLQDSVRGSKRVAVMLSGFMLFGFSRQGSIPIGSTTDIMGISPPLDFHLISSLLLSSLLLSSPLLSSPLISSPLLYLPAVFSSHLFSSPLSARSFLLTALRSFDTTSTPCSPSSCRSLLDRRCWGRATASEYVPCHGIIEKRFSTFYLEVVSRFSRRVGRKG